MKLEVCVSNFWSPMQSRVGSCSELSCLRSEDILSIASFIASELINPGLCCTPVFSVSQTAWRYYVDVVL
jgi:hypothetical protein